MIRSSRSRWAGWMLACVLPQRDLEAVVGDLAEEYALRSGSTADWRLSRSLIAAFAAFWDADPIVLRRARALAALDAEIAESVRARDQRRREHLRTILGRLSEEKGSAPATALPSTVDVLHMLTSFETFDALLGGERSLEEVTQIVRRLAATLLELPDLDEVMKMSYRDPA